LLELKRFYEQIKKEELPEITVKHYNDRLRIAGGLAKKGLTLDVGCRYGDLRSRIASEYIGFDISSKHFRGDFQKVVGDACHLPFRNETFHNVFCLELLEHLIFPAKCVQEANRVLKKDGHLIVSVPNIACLLDRVKILFGMEPSLYGTDSGHLHCFTYSALKRLLEGEGFELTRRAPFYVSIPPRRIFHHSKLLRFTYRLGKLLGHLFPNLDNNIIVSARRR